MSAADVVNMSGKTVEQFKEDAYANAEAYAKQLFIMRKLADEQNIRATIPVRPTHAKTLRLAGSAFRRQTHRGQSNQALT